MIRNTLILSALLLLAAAPALAHGGHAHVTAEEAITVTFTKENGDPLAGLTSRVLQPDGTRYLAGQTDSQGRIVFLPDRPGVWKVKAMSEEGHGGIERVEVGEDLRLVGSQAADHSHDHDHSTDVNHDHQHEVPGHKEAAGGVTFASAVGYLLGAFGVVALILSRKRPTERG